MATALVILGPVLVAGVLALITALPLLRLSRERQLVEQERRLSEWRLAQATQMALQRLLDEARRSSAP